MDYSEEVTWSKIFKDFTHHDNSQNSIEGYAEDLHNDEGPMSEHITDISDSFSEDTGMEMYQNEHCYQNNHCSRKAYEYALKEHLRQDRTHPLSKQESIADLNFNNLSIDESSGYQSYQQYPSPTVGHCPVISHTQSHLQTVHHHGYTNMDRNHLCDSHLNYDHPRINYDANHISSKYDSGSNTPSPNPSFSSIMNGHHVTNYNDSYIRRMEDDSILRSNNYCYEYIHRSHAPYNSTDHESASDSETRKPIVIKNEDFPVRRGPGRPKGSKKDKREKLGRLWEFIRDLLLNPESCPSLICWENYEEGTFRFVRSDRVAKLWGAKRGNEDMTYEKLSRAMRYYYKSEVLQPVLGRRLVYKFGPQARGWKTANPNFTYQIN